MNRRRLVLAWATLLLLWPASARAQEAKSTNPHGKLAANVDCLDCHDVKAWTPVRTIKFDHNKQTSFTLVGAHRDAKCAACHLDLRWSEPKLSNVECASCHVDVHRGNLSTNCAECHNTKSFTDVPGVALHAKTSFPLTGAHLQVSCESCHRDDRGGAFTTLDTDCLSCHEREYLTAQPVDHLAAGFPTNCQQCHTTLAFAHSVTFDHVTVSRGFQLVGAHSQIRCASCHDANLGPLYSPANQNDCIACHQSDFQRVHAGTGFPENCLACHTNLNWSGVSVDHLALSGGFGLVGAHARLDCATCHNPTKAPLLTAAANQNDCIACHQSDYDREHSGTGFPVTCLTCHTVDSWGGATFADHDAQFFPIFSGPHRGKWDTCETCHTVAGNFQSFTCFNCHEHRQTAMDDKHSGVSGYVYESNACYSCHPTGRKEN